MSSLTPHVTNFELSKRLKEAGVPQKSLFWWVNFTNSFIAGPVQGQFRVVSAQESHALIVAPTKKMGERLMDMIRPDEWVERCPAYLASELGDILSRSFNEWSQGWNDSGCFWHFRFGERGCGNMLEGFGIKFSALELGGDDEPEATEANARALAVIYLVKEGVIKFN